MAILKQKRNMLHIIGYIRHDFIVIIRFLKRIYQGRKNLVRMRIEIVFHIQVIQVGGRELLCHFNGCIRSGIAVLIGLIFGVDAVPVNISLF